MAVFGFTINSVSPDCNTNGLVDSVDIARGESNDCHGNGVPDECEGGPWYYADVDSSGAVDLDDLTDMLAGLSGQWEKVPATVSDLDIAPCSGNGDLNLRDLLAMLDTLGGVPRRADPCPKSRSGQIPPAHMTRCGPSATLRFRKHLGWGLSEH